MKTNRIFFAAFFAAAMLSIVPSARAADATQIVSDAVHYWRDNSSYADATMVIHRSDFERRMKLRSWTKGSDESLIRFVEPPKDAGNASLTVSGEMWSYSPKVNRVIKIPPSMVHQSWMGSDFSYNDLAKADSIVTQYDHRILSEEKSEGLKVWVVESVPHENAAVVWGKEVLKIRSDKIILEHDFFDQDGTLVKRMIAREIKPMDGKLFAAVLRMENAENKDEWTEVTHERVRFNVNLPDSMFKSGNLSNAQAFGEPA